jgi:hypothetical protein
MQDMWYSNAHGFIKWTFNIRLQSRRRSKLCSVKYYIVIQIMIMDHNI